MYDIWTFTDASVATNQNTGIEVCVYGFAHCIISHADNMLIPVSRGIRTCTNIDVHTGEVWAIHMALIDIQRFYLCKIGIFTDSDAAVHGIKEHYGNSRGIGTKPGLFKDACINCASYYQWLAENVVRPSLVLCKSHSKPGLQKNYLRKQQDPYSDDEWYVRNICFGNSYIDYLVSNIAITGDLQALEQYGKTNQPSFRCFNETIFLDSFNGDRALM